VTALSAPTAVAAPLQARLEVAEPDQEMSLLIPEDDVADPEFSIVIPALNEQLTISEFIDWCKQGLQAAGVTGEILIVDSLIMGDCDCTYDFRELAPFAEKFRAGAEFVMGSRFRGYIEPGSMPPLHRYFGTPVTTWILNVIFSSRFSDIHCGMRGIRKDALVRMGLRSQSWEYASEMVLKSVHMGLRTEEVPIRFLKDRDGRLSHHKRSGWFSPWQAAWINLRAMFVYGAGFFLFKPGMLMLLLGALLTLPLSFGPVQVGAIEFSLYWMLLGLTLFVLGLQAVYFGILSQVFSDYSGTTTQRWMQRFSYDRTVWMCVLGFGVGLLLDALLFVQYVRQHFVLFEFSQPNYLAVTGLLLMIAAFMTFTFTLVLHSTVVAVWRKP
jgi:hypothetical protein